MEPVSIEGHYDEALSVLGILDEIRQGEAEAIDGYVIACFGNFGLYSSAISLMSHKNSRFRNLTS